MAQGSQSQTDEMDREDNEMKYEMSWNSNGIRIVLWEIYDDGDVVSRDGAWYTWEEVFYELTGEAVEEHHLDIV